MNSLLLGLTALLILVLSALFAAPLFIDWNEYRPVFEAQATKLLGREVKVGGDVHLVLLPAPELRFDDVKVADENGNFDSPLLTVRRLEAWLNVGSLLTGTVEARKIAVVDPALHLDLKDDGTGNWADVGRAGVPLPFAPKEVMLDAVSIEGGTVEVTKRGVPQFKVTGLEGDASASSLSGPYKVSVAYDFEDRRQELRFSTNEAGPDGAFRLKASLRDPERSASYQLDGTVTGLEAQPSFDGNLILRVASAPEDEDMAAGTDADAQATPAPSPAGDAPSSIDNASFFELKGPLTATANQVALPNFDLTIHSKGHPQILKGSLSVDMGETLKSAAKLNARFVDLDRLFGTPGAEQQPSPASVLYMFADWAVDEAASLGDASLQVSIEQAGLGGDIIGDLDIALATGKDGLKIQNLQATLPGTNHVQASGDLSRGEFGPVFKGPVKLEGSGLKALTRWASGDRDISGQASADDFSLAATASIGDGALALTDVQGALSGTKFGGGFSLKGGERNQIELSLDSERLDLRQLIGEGPIWRAWLPAAGATPQATEAKASDESTAPHEPAAGEDRGTNDDTAPQGLFEQLRDADARVTLHVGELLLPNMPPGRLDARFALLNDTLDLQALEFTSGDELSLSGKGRIERVSDAPSGRVDFGLKAATTDSLRLTSELFGLSPSVTKSKHLSALAPLDVQVSLVAAKSNEASTGAIDIRGKAGGSDVAIAARASGDLAKPADATIDIDGSVAGERPQALLVLLFPDLPAGQFASTPGSQGRLSVKLKGVPSENVTGKLALETTSMQFAFDGQGSLQPAGLALTGNGSFVSQDASLVLGMLGLESPPSASAVPVSLQAALVKQGPSVKLTGITGTVLGEPLSANASFDIGDDKTKVNIATDAGTVSLPSLLGVLVAWQRTPSTEELLGTVGSSVSDVWPARGFSLGLLDRFEGDIALNAKTLNLGTGLPLAPAKLTAHIGKDGLTVTDLQGGMFGGTFAGSGSLSPRGAGAALEAIAELKGAKLEQAAKALSRDGVVKGPFDLTLMVQGEGLSPPGVVAGLNGEGTLSLGAGQLQALNPDPLRRLASASAKKAKADKAEIDADTRELRDNLTKGLYKYPPAKLPFEVKSGTLRFVPTTLAGGGAETKINAYAELASLRLDSEWQMSLTDKANKDFPPVGLVFAGPLNKAGEIAPTVDTAAIESYLAMRSMQQGVEGLEKLDVSGRTPPPAPPAPQAETAAPALPPAPAPEAAEPPSSTARTDLQHGPELQSAPSAETPPAPTEAVQMPVPNAEPPQDAQASGNPFGTPPEPQNTDQPALLAEPPLPEAKPDTQATAVEATVAPPVVKPKPRPPRRRAAPDDDWKRGIPYFGNF